MVLLHWLSMAFSISSGSTEKKSGLVTASTLSIDMAAESVDVYRNAPYWQDMNIVAIKSE